MEKQTGFEDANNELLNTDFKKIVEEIKKLNIGENVTFQLELGVSSSGAFAGMNTEETLVLFSQEKPPLEISRITKKI